MTLNILFIWRNILSNKKRSKILGSKSTRDWSFSQTHVINNELFWNFHIVFQKMLLKTFLWKITFVVQWYINRTILFCSINHTLFCMLFIFLNTYISCRDNIEFSRDFTPTRIFEYSEYQCDGNETIIHECSTGGRVCLSDRNVRTRLTCKSEYEYVYTSI